MVNPDRQLCCGRGMNGLNIVLLLFAYKLRYPDQCAPLAQPLRLAAYVCVADG